MNRFFPFFHNHPFISLHVFTLAAAFFSFQYFIERFLSPSFGMGWAYVVDQTLPFIITIATTIFFLLKNGNLKTIHARLKEHYPLLVLIFTVAFITHVGILYYFFWSDEVGNILRPITQNEEFSFHQMRTASMRGYFVVSYAITYLLFGLNAWVYPLFSITYFAISVLFVYWFSYLLSKRRAVATLTSLFFATTPAYLDMFTWHSTAHAPILILGLISFILLLYYKRNNLFIYYILSLMFFFVAIKMGFVRSAGFTFVPLLLLVLPLYKTKLKSLQPIVHALPFFLIALYFFLFEFFHLEIVTAAKILSDTGNFNQTSDFLFGYRGLEGNSFSLLPKLLYFSAHLFIPSGLASEILPFSHALLPNISLAMILGSLGLLGMFVLFFIALRYRLFKERALVIFATVFVILNILHSVIGFQASSEFNPTNPGFAKSIDIGFAQEGVGYGPGSRYLFISSVGISLLFALFTAKLAKKGKASFIVAVALYLVVTLGNTYFTIRAQVMSFDGMTIYKSLVSNIFKIVPRDQKPKLLFSTNPESNSLDRKFGGWKWLHGFYKENELLYSSDPQEVKDLIKNNGYMRENLYAFYHNPQTLAFTDISEEVRDYFLTGTENVNQKTASPLFSQKKSLAKPIAEINTTILERAVIESLELNQRIIGREYLRFKLKMQKIVNPPLPFSDAILIGKDKAYTYNFPLNLWERIVLPPKFAKTQSALLPDNYDLVKQRQFYILSILKKSDSLMAGTTIKLGKAIDDNIVKSLIDGFYTTYPNPTEEERYFIAQENPLILTFYFPYQTRLGRILLNTPNSYTSTSPLDITISASLDNKQFHKVATIQSISEWSPNHGRMYEIDLDKGEEASSIQLEIIGTSETIAFDEIIVDEESALEYSPQVIHETARRAYHYVDSKELFDQLSQITRYNHLSVLWACAEDFDWQQQIKNRTQLVPGIWNVAKIMIQPGADEVGDRIATNCYGTKLRQIFFVGPPYPVEMELVDVSLEPGIILPTPRLLP